MCVPLKQIGLVQLRLLASPSPRWARSCTWSLPLSMRPWLCHGLCHLPRLPPEPTHGPACWSQFLPHLSLGLSRLCWVASPSSNLSWCPGSLALSMIVYSLSLPDSLASTIPGCLTLPWILGTLRLIDNFENLLKVWALENAHRPHFVYSFSMFKTPQSSFTDSRAHRCWVKASVLSLWGNTT